MHRNYFYVSLLVVANHAVVTDFATITEKSGAGRVRQVLDNAARGTLWASMAVSRVDLYGGTGTKEPGSIASNTPRSLLWPRLWRRPVSTTRDSASTCALSCVAPCREARE